MKYIIKDEIPQYFSDEVNFLKNQLEEKNKKRREVFDSLKCKSELHRYILEKEQHGLCGYCEAQIQEINKSHIEHVEPISRDKSLVFDYSNLIVSCNGICFNDENKRLTCGHRKDTKGYKPNYNLFLSPTKIENIREYFIYTDNGFIGASKLKEEFSIETLRVLNLNDPDNKLPEERIKSLEEFKKSIQKHAQKTGKSIRDITVKILDKENLAFISFLRFKYKNIL
jgi:uncharacterized protein (TIGR02646 family)